MSEELEFLKSIEINSLEDVTESTFSICKAHFNFITDEIYITEDEIPSVFVIPKNTLLFEYSDTIENPQALALTKDQYFEFIFEKIQFTEDLTGIEYINI